MDNSPDEVKTATIIFLSSAIALLPIFAGFLLGHITRQTLQRVVVPMFLFSAISMVAILPMNRQSHHPIVWIASIVFGFFWLGLSWRMSASSDQFLKKIRWMFLIFGITWMGMTAFQFYVSHYAK